MSVAAAIVLANKAFSGFPNPVLPPIVAALTVSAAIILSGAIEILVRRLRPLMKKSPDLQVGVLVGCVVLPSAFFKNIGALAIFIPVIPVQGVRQNSRLPSSSLMPLSFALLLGGSMTLVGTQYPQDPRARALLTGQLSFREGVSIPTAGRRQHRRIGRAVPDVRMAANPIMGCAALAG